MVCIEISPKSLFPNQRTIKIHKKPVVSGNFTTISVSATMHAMHDLSYSAYMLYSYLSLNADKYEFYLSKEFLCNNTALTRNTYYKAFDELEEKGYLVLRQGYDTKYDFYEFPKTGHTCAKKQDGVCPKTAENTNNNIEKNKESFALSLEATDSAPAINEIFF